MWLQVQVRLYSFKITIPEYGYNNTPIWIELGHGYIKPFLLECEVFPFIFRKFLRRMLPMHFILPKTVCIMKN